MFEVLEDRRPLALTVNLTPRLQLGNVALVEPTDRIEVLWQTSGVNDLGDTFTLDYKLPGQTWAQAITIPHGAIGSFAITAHASTDRYASRTNWSVAITELSYGSSE